jgi:hypothetical protein
MSWYDYLDGSAALGAVSGRSPSDWAAYLTGTGQYDPTNTPRANLDTAGANATGFAQQAQGNYNQDTGQAQQSVNDLRAIANGQNSVSAMQLQQAAQANQAQQASMAAAASPNNAPMAARNAAMNAGRIGYGLAGQQAVAGLQERNQATSQLANFIGNLRGQDVNATLGGQGNAINAYGQQIQNPQKTTGQQILNAGIGVASALSAKSDRRAKTDIKDGDSDASKALEGLRSYTFAYKNEKDGKGKQVGVMAQEMRKAGLGHAVIAKAATSGLALTAALARRVAKLEGKAA